MTNAALIGMSHNIDRVYLPPQRARLEQLVNLHPTIITEDTLSEAANCEFLFSTWGMPRLSHEQLDQLPNLKAVFYGAGTVQGFAHELLERGITVTSSWAANGIPVAEFTLAQILLSMKGYWRNSEACHHKLQHELGNGGLPQGPGVFGARVALIGFGAIARHLATLLRPFHLEVMAYDPYVSDDIFAAHNVTHQFGGRFCYSACRQ